MNTTSFDELPDDIKQRLIESQRNYQFANEISDLIRDNFVVCELSVAITSDKTASISGVVNNESEKQKIETYLTQSDKIKNVINGLIIVNS